MAIHTIDDQPVYMREEGPSNGPIAILVHGWSSSSFTWAPVLPMLSRRYRCIAVDLPGFGESPPPKIRPTIRGYANLIAKIAEQFSERPALVLGHSMGGQIAATLALHHPMLVERLVLLCPALSGRLSTRVRLLLAPHVRAERSRVLEWLLHLGAKTPLDYTDYLLKPSNFAERAHVSEEAYQRIREDARRRGQGRIRAACYVAMQQGDLSGKLGQIEAPALVIWGAEDNVVPLRDAGMVAAEWPRADLRIIPNAGHWPQFEQPDVTLRHIRQFLGLPPEVSGEHVNDDLARIQEYALFLNNTEIGSKLTEAQRLRLASLVHTHSYGPDEIIAEANTMGEEMFIVKEGTLEVWLRPNKLLQTNAEPVRLAVMSSGQVVGELALLDGSVRSADLLAGAQGVTLLSLSQQALDTLAEDDPEMGMRMMQSLAISLGRRLRLQNWRAARFNETAGGARSGQDVPAAR